LEAAEFGHGRGDPGELAESAFDRTDAYAAANAHELVTLHELEQSSARSHSGLWMQTLLGENRRSFEQPRCPLKNSLLQRIHDSKTLSER